MYRRINNVNAMHKSIISFVPHYFYSYLVQKILRKVICSMFGCAVITPKSHKTWKSHGDK